MSLLLAFLAQLAFACQLDNLLAIHKGSATGATDGDQMNATVGRLDTPPVK